jgi:hypothetical protein
VKIRIEIVKHMLITGEYSERHDARVTLQEQGYTLVLASIEPDGVELLGEKSIAGPF